MQINHTVHIYVHEDGACEGCADLGVQLEEFEEQLMSKLTDFLSQQDDYNNKMDQLITNLRSDIEGLHTELQNGISNEDSSALDRAASKSSALVDRLTQLDDLTPPDTSSVPTDGSTGTGAATPGQPGTDATAGPQTASVRVNAAGQPSTGSTQRTGAPDASKTGKRK